MIFRLYKVSYLTVLLLFLALPSLLNAYNLEFDVTADTVYLPYKSFEVWNSYKQEDCSFPEYNLLEVVKPAIKNVSDGLLILSNNPSLNRNQPSMFTPRIFPGFEVTDDDPIDYVITNWKSYILGPDRSVYVVGACHNDDSIFAFKLYVDTDSVEYKLLYTRQSGDDGPVIPNVSVLYLGDFGAGGDMEILLFVEYRRYFRKLFLLDFKTLEPRWSKSIASGVNPTTIQVFGRGENARIMFTTGNSANGMTDSVYDDYFSFLTVLDQNGEFILNQLTSRYGARIPELIESDIENEYFITHYLDFATGDSAGSKALDEYYLSRMDDEGKLLKSINIKSTPIKLWLMKYGDSDQLRLFVLFSSKTIEMYDCGLTLLEETDVLEKAMLYNGRYKIAGERDSVYVFSDGLYDKELNKLLQFPFYSGNFSPVEYDTAGNMTAYLITGYLHFYIGYIQKRTNLELASVFYYRNKNYVLIFLTSLLVALITTNIFRRRSKLNLALISIQKTELEGLHEDLKAAQEKIVAQEKYEQAKDIAGGFAHEIRNALSPARYALSKLLPMTGVSEEGKRTHTLADLSKRGVIKALELTQQISNYTKLESLKDPEPVNLAEVVDEVLQAQGRIIEDCQIAVSFSPSDTPKVLANTDQLRIVVTNLVSNAIDAMQTSADKQLLINTRESETSVELSITDTGCGIPHDDLTRVFDFFYSTKPNTGTGIGLAISKKIIELYDGSIAVDCTESGRTTFTVRCPRVS